MANTDPYSTDMDLPVYEPNLMSEGVDGFEKYHDLAKTDIDRILKSDWWPGAVRTWATSLHWDLSTKALNAEAYDFDPQYLITPTQLKALACFRVLGWYAFEVMAKYGDAEPDRYEKKKEVYQDRFREEMALVLAGGIDYDFSRDGQLQVDETAVLSKPRRARRA